MLYEWDEQKNEWLERERGISFEEIECALDNGALVDEFVLAHYPQQTVQLVKIDNYIWVVATEPRGYKTRLITAYQSRKFTKKYL